MIRPAAPNAANTALTIDLHRDPAGILSAAMDQEKKAAAGDFAASTVKLVAGEGLGHYHPKMPAVWV